MCLLYVVYIFERARPTDPQCQQSIAMSVYNSQQPPNSQIISHRNKQKTKTQNANTESKVTMLLYAHVIEQHHFPHLTLLHVMVVVVVVHVVDIVDVVA